MKQNTVKVNILLKQNVPPQQQVRLLSLNQQKVGHKAATKQNSGYNDNE